MAIEKKVFLGGLDSDTEDRLLPNGDYRYSLNIRASKSDGANEGSIENTKGNTLVSFNLGTSQLKCIGAYDDKLNNKVYYFIWSNGTEHSIVEYDVDVNVISTVLKDPLLNFYEDKLIFEQNVAVISGLLYWTDSENPPMGINIERAKSGLYPSPLRIEDIQAIKSAPNVAPISEFKNDTTVKINNVRNKLFQFRYKFVYLDNEESAWSPISKVALPVDETQYRPFSYYDTSLNNYINVAVRYNAIDNPLVKRIKISFREGNLGDFYLAKDIKIEDFTTIADSYEFNFYNDENYTAIDNNGNSGMRLFDWIPLKSNTLSLIDGNRLSYGGITEGYDPIDINIKIDKIYSTQAEVPAPTTGVIVGFQSTDGILAGLDFTSIPYNITPYNPAQVGITVNGAPYFLHWVWSFAGVISGGLGSVFPQYGFPSDFIAFTFGAPTSGIQYLTTAQIKAVIVGNPNGEAGIRYTMTVKVTFFNWDKNNFETKNIKVQYLTVAGDGRAEVLNGLKAALLTNNYATEYVDFSFGNFDFQYAPTASNAGVIPANAAALKFVVRVFMPPVKVANIPGLTPFGVPAAAGGVGVTPLPCVKYSEVSINAYAAWTTRVEKSLKNGSTHGIGMVYYDSPNRSGLVNISNEKLFYVPFPTERSVPSGNLISDTDLQLTIKHTPPSWAKYYQIVYTGNQTIERLPGVTGYNGFIQCKLRLVKASSIPGATECLLTELSDFNSTTPEVTGLGYSFTKGDRIRLLMNASGNYLQQYTDVEIVSYDSTSYKLVFKTPDVSVSDGYTVEIYTPKLKTTDTFYYEIGEIFPIINGFHEGNIQNQDATNDAIIDLDDIGDVYLRFRVSPTSRQIEDYHFSDYYDSDVWDMGRPNIVDNNINQTYRPTTIRYSGAFIPETNINGLSQFNDLAFEAYDHKYGDIMLMYSEDKGLNIFQKLKVGQVGVNQTTLYSNDGSTVGTVGSDTRVLSDIRYYAGEYGIGDHPESFAVYGNMKYWVDVKRGAVLRLGGDGITPISEYKMHNYFNDILELMNNSSNKPQIFGVYDVRFDEYVIHLSNDTIKETIAYSEFKNRWVTFYSYEPDFMVSNKTGLISFKDGQLYTHNTNSVYNNFYGAQYNTVLEFISNIEPSANKIYNSLFVESSHVFEMPEATNQFGQKTSLITDDFEDVEGVWKSAFLKDENTPNLALPLIEGDTIRCHSLTVQLQNVDTELVKIFSVGLNVELSELTNR